MLCQKRGWRRRSPFVSQGCFIMGGERSSPTDLPLPRHSTQSLLPHQKKLPPAQTSSLALARCAHDYVPAPDRPCLLGGWSRPFHPAIASALIRLDTPPTDEAGQSCAEGGVAVQRIQRDANSTQSHSRQSGWR